MNEYACVIAQDRNHRGSWLPANNWLMERLNELGREGWQLVTVCHDHGNLTAYLGR